ncbi:copper chaperone PCu(A)C [Novosphingobium panipatense]|jgi:copper(I)-binding protein
MKRALPLSLIASFALVMSITGCGKEPDSPTENNEATALGPNAKPGIAASDARMVLPVIAGRPAAVYFTIRNNAAEPVTIAGVHVAGAENAEMHETKGGTMRKVDSLPLEPGASMVFAPGGLHVMAFNLSPDLKTGSRGELTVTFSDGDKISMPLELTTMGGDTHGMEGMQH